MIIAYDSYLMLIFAKSRKTALTIKILFFSDRIKSNWAAFNMYGLLLEQQELCKSAAQAFEKYLLFC